VCDRKRGDRRHVRIFRAGKSATDGVEVEGRELDSRVLALNLGPFVRRCVAGPRLELTHEVRLGHRQRLGQRPRPDPGASEARPSLWCVEIPVLRRMWMTEGHLFNVLPTPLRSSCASRQGHPYDDLITEPQLTIWPLLKRAAQPRGPKEAAPTPRRVALLRGSLRARGG
jgi:hypothetical protein